MGFLDELVTKARALRSKLSTPKDEGIHHDAIIHDRFDEWTWRDLLGEVPALRRDITELGMSHDYVDDAYQDTYNMLHQGDPLLRDRKTVEELHRPNVDMMEMFLDSNEVKSLRTSTANDQYASAMGMLGMKSALRDAYERAAEARQAAKDAKEQQEQLQNMLNELGTLVAMAGGTTPGSDEEAELGDQIQGLMGQIQAQAGITDAMLEAAQQAAQQAAQESLADVKAAAKQAAKDIEDEKEAARAFGMEDGQLQRMSFAERQALAHKLRNVNDLQGFAKMIGQARNMEIGEARHKVTNAPDEIVGARLSNDLAHLTSNEYVNLADPDLETDFLRRFTEEALLTYQLQGREKMAKGPVICIPDESGSMGGVPEQWASGISMALCQRCQRDGRDFYYIGFSSAGQQYLKEFPNGQGSIDDVIDIVTHFFGGGTHYETPLSMALDIVERYHREGKPKPDIVFITDDAYTRLSDDFITRWNKVKKETDMRCFGILLGSFTHQSGALESVADNTRIIPDTDLNNLDNVRDIFRVL